MSINVLSPNLSFTRGFRNDALFSFRMDGVKYGSVCEFALRITLPPAECVAYGPVLRELIPHFPFSEREYFRRKIDTSKVYYYGETFPYGSDEHNMLIKRAIRCKFFQNKYLLRVLIEETGNQPLVCIPYMGCALEVLKPEEFAELLSDIRAEELCHRKNSEACA